MAAHGWLHSVASLAFAAAVVLAPPHARADNILLTNGQVVSGKLFRYGDQVVIRKDDGSVLTIKAGDVKSVTLTGAITPLDKSQDEWSRISADVAKSDDLRTITATLALFVKNYPDVPLTKTAQDMLDQYNQYAAQGFVKFRNHWMAATARDAIVHQADTQAKLALTLYRSGKLKESLAAAQDALKTDDQNSLALSLCGLAMARANQWSKAKDSFQQLVDSNPDSVLGYNNLAIVLYIQHHEPEGLLDYKKALDIAPGNRLLMDNILQALGAFQGDKTVPAYTDLVRAFTQADAQLSADMAKKGLYRYGSTWVTQDQRDKLLGAIGQIQTQMATLDANYQAAVANLRSLDMQSQQTTVDFNGTFNNMSSITAVLAQEQARGILDLQLSSQRDTLQTNLNQLTLKLQDINTQRSTTQDSMKQMHVQADQLKAELAAAQATNLLGVQRMMEVGDDVNPPPPPPVQMPVVGAPAVPSVLNPAPVNPAINPVSGLAPAGPPAVGWPAVAPQPTPPG